MSGMEDLKKFSGRTNDVVNTLKSLKAFLSDNDDIKANHFLKTKSFCQDIDCMIADVMIQDRKYYDIWKDLESTKKDLKLAMEVIGETAIELKKQYDKEDSDE